MLQSYPIRITTDPDFLSVYVPDFDVNTQGKTLEEALLMAKDVILLMSSLMVGEGKDIPTPTDIYKVQTESQKEILALVQVEFSEITKSVIS